MATKDMILNDRPCWAEEGEACEVGRECATGQGTGIRSSAEL